MPLILVVSSSFLALGIILQLMGCDNYDKCELLSRIR